MSTATDTSTLATAVHVPLPTNISAVCGDSGRFTTGNPALAVSNGEAAWVATDGRMAAYVPVTPAVVENTTAGPNGLRIVQVGAVKACKRGKRGPVPMLRVEPDGTTRKPGEPTTWEPVSGVYPPVEDILPKRGACEGRQAITLNAKFLAKLAEAIGAEDGAVTLLIPKASKIPHPFVVFPSRQGPENALGLLMPIGNDGDSTAEGEARIEKVRSILTGAKGGAA